MQRSGLVFRCVSLFLSLVAVGLTGCGMSTLSSPVDTALKGVSLQGKAYGGETPLTGAAIYLYAVGTSGYGGAATSLLNPADPGVSTDSNGLGYVATGAGGTFSITGDYHCASATTQIYLVVLGGNPGMSGVVNNAGIGEMLALGPCGTTPSTTPIFINEVSTVAAVTALSQFMTPGTVNVSTSATNMAGLVNSFVTASNLVSPYSIQPNQTTPSGLGAIPYQELNTLADVLSTCVNTGSATSSTCGTLFTAATPPNGTAPKDTLQAMLNIARYPAQNVGTLFNMVTTNPPFQPTLAPTNYSNGQPNDWTMAIVYSNSFVGLNFLRIDSQANVWAVGSGRAYKISNAGALIYNITSQTVGTNNFNQVLAVDLNDNLWIDDNSYAVTNISSNGVLNCYPGNNPYCYIPGIGSGYASVYGSLNILNGFGGIAIDANNYIWAGTGGALTQISQSGIGLQDYTGNGVAQPTSVAIDSTGNFWLANREGGYGAGGNTIAVVSPAGAPVLVYGGSELNEPIAIAFDHLGKAWIGNEGNFTLTRLSVSTSGSSTSVSSSTTSGGGLYFINDVAVDGLNNVWASSYDTMGLAEFNSAGSALSPSTGFYAGAGDEAGSVAIDSSGNVWVTTFNAATVNEMVGVAGPTVTPIALATKNGTLGTRP